MGNKAVFLLFLLMVTVFGTAAIMNRYISVEDMLNADTEVLTKNIHKKEAKIQEVFQDSAAIRLFENVERYPTQVLEFTDDYSDKHFIYFYIFKNKSPIFWSTNKVMPRWEDAARDRPVLVKDKMQTYYLARKDLASDISVLALIPIKREYIFSNEFLSNKFYPQIIPTNNLEIANYDDTEYVKNVYSTSGTYLFSVKHKTGKIHNSYLTIQMVLSITGILLLLILVNYFCIKLVSAGKAWYSFIPLVATVALLKFFSLEYNFIAEISNSGFFNPKHYAYNPFLPNLWEFVTTTFYVAWILFYIKSIEKQLIQQNKIRAKALAIVLSSLGLASIFLFSHTIFEHLSSLITHTSAINMDFNDLLGFSTFSWINLFVYCLNIVLLLFYINFVVNQIRRMIDNVTIEVNLLLIFVIISILASAVFYKQAFLYTFVVNTLVFIRAYSQHKLAAYQLLTFVVSLICLSVLAVLIYDYSTRIEKQKEMALSLNYLEADNDLRAFSLFSTMEINLESDQNFHRLLERAHSNPQFITNYLVANYFGGYLSKYEQQFYYYLNGEPLQEYGNNKLLEYREKVINNSTRVSQTKYYYRVRSELGTHEYFMQLQLPINDGQDEVQIFVNLKNRSYSFALPYPEILLDYSNDLARESQYKNIAFALYKDHNLLTQYGNYVYPTDDLKFDVALNKHVMLRDNNGHYHMILKPDAHTSIIVSKPINTISQTLSLVSFLFLSIFLVYMASQFINFITTNYLNKLFNFRLLRYQFILLTDRIRYSTKIQTMVIITVIAAILISGTIAFFTIRGQLDSSLQVAQEKMIEDVARKVENIVSETQDANFDQNAQERIKEINKYSPIDLNIFSEGGKLIYTSQPRLYELGLVSTYMNPSAYNNLNVIKKANVAYTENFGLFEFTSSYSTILNNEYQTVAFINVPNFSSKQDEISSSNLLLNTLLNIYTVIILVAGFITVFISKRITKPLEIVGKKLAETNLGEKNNEPIYWNKDDEIGALIKEYNLMLVKIEESTKQLMNAEREYAWREMAQQVAHEIKNPLTPMKLGVQHLMRAFHADDPRFEERFTKFAASFIEQIDSLSKIAGEFSHFAQLPNTQLTQINLIESIWKVVNFHLPSANIVIKVENLTNRDEVQVIGDHDQFIRTFNNLIKNATEATRGRRKTLINIRIELKENKVVIHFSDNGIGIAPEVLPKIFQPNFTTKSSGTGLGLAFVKKTIESMNGDITFTTRINEGTTFTITLPMITDETSPN